MTDDKSEHIDLYFKEQFTHVEALYNDSHWELLQQALMNPLGGDAMVPKNMRTRLKLFLKNNRMAFILTTTLAVLFTIVLLRHMERSKIALPPIIISRPKTFEDLSTLSHEVDSAVDGRHGTPNDTANFRLNPYVLHPDSVITKFHLQTDSIDSLRVDSIKKSLFIFW